MGRTVKMMVSCGSGIATSTHVANKAKAYLDKQGLSVEIMTCSVQDLPNRLTGCDVVLSTAQVAFDPGVPVFNGIPLLTNVGQDKVLADLAATIKEISEK